VVAQCKPAAASSAAVRPAGVMMGMLVFGCRRERGPGGIL